MLKYAPVATGYNHEEFQQPKVKPVSWLVNDFVAYVVNTFTNSVNTYHWKSSHFSYFPSS